LTASKAKVIDINISCWMTIII